MTEEKHPDVPAAMADISKMVDSSFALVSTALIDRSLETLLLHAMRPLSKTVKERIFESFGPLNELAAKIDLVYAFNLIDDDTLAELRVVKDIRNKFAHAADLEHFDSPEVGHLCRKLKNWKKECDHRDLFGTTMDCLFKTLKSNIEQVRLKHDAASAEA